MTGLRRRAGVLTRVLAPLALGVAVLLGTPGPVAASAASSPAAGPADSVIAAASAPQAPTAPVAPTAPADPDGAPADGKSSVTLDVDGKPSTSVVILIALTLLSVAPSLLLLMTSFTKIVIVLSLARNALGLTNTPPAQVITGLALFLSLFVMAPVLSQVNELGVQPYLAGEELTVAAKNGVAPLREFMLKNTRDGELALFLQVAEEKVPAERSSVPLATLVPAFLISEIKSAFIIGFVVFIPFLIIDLVVSAVLMSMGMMMLPPVLVSLPFKLLLFVMVDGWALLTKALVSSYQ
jgi:flagellar biosynthetic protein FliP